MFPIARYGVDRPMLLVGIEGFRDERFERSWSAMLAYGGYTRWRQLDNPNHWVIHRLRRDGTPVAGRRADKRRRPAQLVGAIAPAQSVPVIRSFFDRHL